MTEADDADWTRHVVLITGPDGKGHGSGFVVRRAGAVSHVVTCAHVVADLGTPLVNGRAAKILWDGTPEGIDLAALAVEGLTEEALSLTRVARVGDEVLAVGFTRVDRGRRATARPAKIREATQLTYDPVKVVKHGGWLLDLEGDGITDGFSGGPVVAADTGLVVGVLGLRGQGTADAIGIANLAVWKDAPPAVSPIRDEVANLRRTSLRSRGMAFTLGGGLSAAVVFLLVRDREVPRSAEQTTAERLLAAITENNRLLKEAAAAAGSGEQTVRADAGWQVSRELYRTGERLCVEVGGRVNVAKHEAHHLIEIGPALMTHFADPDSALWRSRVGRTPDFSKIEPFRVSTTGPQGVLGVEDDLLGPCILRPQSGWGALLVVQLPELGFDDYDARDPLRVLIADANLERKEIEAIGARRELTMERSGRLAFIVNDYVLSDLSRVATCKEGFRALRNAASELAQDPEHQIDVDAIPLFWYADNEGEFRVRIRKMAATEVCQSSDVAMRPGPDELRIEPDDRRDPGGGSGEEVDPSAFARVRDAGVVDAGVPVDARPRVVPFDGRRPRRDP